MPAAPNTPAHIDVPDLPFMFDYSMPIWGDGSGAEPLDFVDADSMSVPNGHFANGKL